MSSSLCFVYLLSLLRSRTIYCKEAGFSPRVYFWQFKERLIPTLCSLLCPANLWACSGLKNVLSLFVFPFHPLYRSSFSWILFQFVLLRSCNSRVCGHSKGRCSIWFGSSNSASRHGKILSWFGTWEWSGPQKRRATATATRNFSILHRFQKMTRVFLPIVENITTT